MTNETHPTCDRPHGVHTEHGPCVLHMGFFHLGPVKEDGTRGAWLSQEVPSKPQTKNK